MISVLVGYVLKLGFEIYPLIRDEDLDWPRGLMVKALVFGTKDLCVRIAPWSTAIHKEIFFLKFSNHQNIFWVINSLIDLTIDRQLTNTRSFHSNGRILRVWRVWQLRVLITITITITRLRHQLSISKLPLH